MPSDPVTAPRIFTPEYYARLRAMEADGWWNAGMRDAAALLLDGLELARHGSAIDVGCGSGQTMTWLRARLPEWSVAGLDIAADGLDAARGLGFGLTRASALSIPFRDGCADLVVCLDVLQHLPLDGGDARALAEIRRVLRPRGVLLVRTNAQAFPPTRDDHDADFHRYRPAELRTRLNTAGFEVIRLSRINALLGFAEIPRELRARIREGSGYHGVLSTARPLQPRRQWLRAWLRVEARAIRSGLRLPVGRTILALARVPDAAATA